MHSPPIDKRSHDDVVAWTEQLARGERAVPGPGLVGAVLDRDVVDPTSAHQRVIALAGARVDGPLAEKIAEPAWLDVDDLLLGRTLGRDVENPATKAVHRAGTTVDVGLAQVLEDLARVTGPDVLIGCTLGRDVTDAADGGRLYPAGTVVDAGLAGVIDRLAWVRVATWQPRPDGTPDPGGALVRIAGRFAELVVERVNRAPEKHELAFLNLTGAQPLPPRPARVPLTFTLAASSPVDAVVAAGTQVTASPVEGEADEVVFETERSLVVTRAQLQAVYVGDAETDSYSDRTEEAMGRLDRPFAAFDGDRPTPHHLYLACDQVLTQPGPKDVTLVLRSPDTWQWTNWPISWAYWDGAAWQAAASTATVSRGAWRVTLAGLPPVTPTTVAGQTAGWLRAQLDMPLPPGRSGLVPESVATGNKQPHDLELPLAPFGETSQNKWFYLSADEAIGDGRALVRLRVELARAGVGPGVKLNWAHQVGAEWRLLGQSSASSPLVGSSDVQLSDGTRGLTRDGEITFHAPAEWPRGLFRNRIGRWLRVEVSDDGSGYSTLPRLGSLEVDSTWELPRVSGVAVQLTTSPVPQPPAAGALNTGELDLSKDFYPFGEQPRFNDTLYLALPDAPARSKADLKLKVTLTNPTGTTGLRPVLTTGGAQVAWEVPDGRGGWTAVVAADTTKAFTASGDVTLTLAATPGLTEVNGVEGRWVRARLVGGHYGLAATYATGKDKQDNTIYLPVDATYAPPVVKKLTVEPVSTQQPEVPPSACLTYNDFTYADRTAIAATGAGGPFTPFAAATDPAPALYLGFDRPFEPRPTTLYLQVEPPLPEDVAAGQLAEIDRTTQAEVTWEHAGPDGWRPLGAVDETRALASRGLVGFIGPDAFTPRACFGQTWHWLRMRWPRGYFPLPPRLRRVLLNTTWATQVVTVEDEILGSSNGDPDQAFTTAQAPVQPGQQVTVRERERPDPAEVTALTALEGADAVDVALDAAGQPDEIWVRWHCVPDFHGSGARDRHYTIDPLTGDVRFGDGQRGLVPPAGQNNVRASYRTGGGEQGNRAVETVVQLTSGVPYVDGVTNHEPAEGGAPREPIDRLRERGPRVLRHRDRAVTAQDLEDLAHEASTGVARAVAVAPGFDPYNLWLDPSAPVPTDDHRLAEAGRMGVIVVPDSAAARPTPSLGLVAEVQAYLQARCPPPADLWVAGPEWVRVTVTATVVPTSLEAADAAGIRARAALERFLHPLTGGPLGQGWAFGRKPHRSDLFALIEGVDGVDHVEALSATHEPETKDDNRKRDLRKMLDQSLAEAKEQPPTSDVRRWLGRALVYSGQHRITVALAR